MLPTATSHFVQACLNGSAPKKKNDSFVHSVHEIVLLILVPDVYSPTFCCYLSLTVAEASCIRLFFFKYLHYICNGVEKVFRSAGSSRGYYIFEVLSRD